jgi:hypothetical protein
MEVYIRNWFFLKIRTSANLKKSRIYREDMGEFIESVGGERAKFRKGQESRQIEDEECLIVGTITQTYQAHS